MSQCSATLGRGPSKQPALENNAKKVGREHEHRVERWSSRGVLWDVSTLRRVRKCGRVPVTTDGSVQVRRTAAGAVGYAGLATCGSVWACPVCNAKIQAHRRLQVGVGLANGLGDGGGAAFGAYTLQHRQGQPLAGLWGSLSACWKSVQQSRAVRAQRAAMGFYGSLRAAEVTHGANGWHPHLHPVHLFERPVTPAEVAALHRVEFRAWRSAAVRLGLSAPAAAAQDLHRVEPERFGDAMGDYFTKAAYPVTAVGWEVTSTQTKTRTRAAASRTPWEVLRDFYTTGDLADLDLWREWEKASKGRHALDWSRGLKARLRVDQVGDDSDEDTAGAVVGTKDDTGFWVTDWAPVVATPALGARLLGVVAGEGWDAGRDFCTAHGISWETR